MISKNEKSQEVSCYSLVTNSNSTVETLECNNNNNGCNFKNAKGMCWLVTCLFIIGETAGGGIIAMPTAMVSTGALGGTLVIVIGAFVCTLTGRQLAKNWTILLQRWPEYRQHCRKPYPAMGLRAVGPKFMSFVSICLNITQFGTAVVFLLLASKNIENFLHFYTQTHVSFCQMLLIVGAAMFPFTLLKSPKDFWWAVIGAMFTTTIAVGLILYATALDFGVCSPAANYPPISASKFFMSFGTVMFAYGGHGAFPTIQHDMRKPYRFGRAVSFAFFIIACMYLPVSLFGYFTYGDSLRDSIIPSLQEPLLQQTVNILITLHVILALTIVFNPLNQEFEDCLKVPQEFSLQRVLIRGATMLGVVFAAESVPNFGVLLDLVGGSTITLMTLVFPAVFNLFLSAGHRMHGGALADPDERPLTLAEVVEFTPRRRLLLNSLIIATAIIGGVTATVSALNAMLGSEFSAPCYAKLLGWWPGLENNNNDYQRDIFSEKTSHLSSSHNSHPLVEETPLLFCCGHSRDVNRLAGGNGTSKLCISPSAASAHFSGGSHG